MDEVFISYRRSDEVHAIRLARALEAAGLSIWWDREIPPGKSFDEVIEAALDAAKCVIVLWSHKSVRSDWVKSEAAEGMARGILVPVLVERVRPPLAFRRIEAADLVEWQGDPSDQEFTQLLTVVRALAAGEGLRPGVTSTLLKAYPRERAKTSPPVEPPANLPPVEPPPPKPPSPLPKPPSPPLDDHTPRPAPQQPTRKSKPRWGLWLLLAALLGGGALIAMIIAIAAFDSVRSFDGLDSGEVHTRPLRGPLGPAEAERGQITLRYPGDTYGGCNLNIMLRIGQQNFVPSGTTASIGPVALGWQQYQIRGSLFCPSLGQCATSGYGEIQVTPGAVFDIFWENSGYQQCTVSLVPAAGNF